MVGVHGGQSSCILLLLFLIRQKQNKRGGSDVFTVRGFVNWKKVHDGKKCAFLNHIGSEPCSEHNNATKACHDSTAELRGGEPGPSPPQQKRNFFTTPICITHSPQPEGPFIICCLRCVETNESSQPPNRFPL